MLYLAYQAHNDLIEPAKTLARQSLAMLGSWGVQSNVPVVRNLSAAYELIARAGLTHARPEYGIPAVTVGNREVEVTEEAVLTLPFGTLLRFKKDIDIPQPRVLVVAPLSGHFATLLRNTVRTLLPDHDVYITDWHNARDVPLEAGAFGFDDYVDYLIKFMEKLGPGAHLVAVCQPCVQALAAVAVMAANGNPAQPSSMTLMAGPIDTRVNPTKVNKLATSKPMSWFERNLIARVPWKYSGAPAHGLSRLRAAHGVRVDERQPPLQRAPGALRASAQRRAREGAGHQDLLRRVFRRARSGGGVLSRDRQLGVPGIAAAEGRADLQGRSRST